MTPTSEERKHTPLPWAWTKHEKEDMISVHIKGADINDDTKDETCCGLWGECGEKERANAELIVTAVNSYYSLKEDNQKLREALKEAQFALQWHFTNSKPLEDSGHSDFFNMTANALTQIESILEESKPLNS